MEIICEGKNKTYEITCFECDSDIRYKKDEIKQGTSEKKMPVSFEEKGAIYRQIRSITEIHEIIFDYIICPVCGNKIIIKSGTRRKVECGEWHKR